MTRTSMLRAVPAGLLVFAGLRLAGEMVPGLPDALARGAAHLAALLLAVPLVGGPEPVLADPTYPVQVVRACSGWSFFSLCAAVLVAGALYRGRGRAALAALPVALVVTLVVNAGRLAAVVAGGRYVLPHLPPLAVVSFHTALGVALFLPALIGTWIVWQRRLYYVR
jgi:exosortase/archaeosortase family protein